MPESSHEVLVRAAQAVRPVSFRQHPILSVRPWTRTETLPHVLVRLYIALRVAGRDAYIFTEVSIPVTAPHLYVRLTGRLPQARTCQFMMNARRGGGTPQYLSGRPPRGRGPSDRALDGHESHGLRHPST